MRVEPLEGRRLLAAQTFTETDQPAGEVAATIQSSSDQLAPYNLVQFAKDLKAAGVVLYGAAWCPTCTQQAELFEDGAKELPFVEVTRPDRSISPLAIEKNITVFPTWEFPDGSRVIGIRSLDEISSRSGVPIPRGGSPQFEFIGDQTVSIGSPLHVPIDAYDPYGGPLTVTVSVDDPDLLEAQVVAGNRSIRIDLETYGDLVFELFEQRAPVASGRMIELAQSGFYDGIDFHRVIDNFVIQGGDPTGTGTGGSTLDDFDDDYHAELQYNRSGVLGFAKSGDDTNNSQFFITETPTRFLDFNYSIFGQLVEGEAVREAISGHAVNHSNRPTSDITIETIEVFNDLENSIVMLKPTGDATGRTHVTVTVANSFGATSSETFAVEVQQDNHNSQPFLNAIAVAESYPNDQAATIQITSTDIEGDAVAYSAEIIGGLDNAIATIDEAGQLVVMPRHGFSGTVDVVVTVRPGSSVHENSLNDRDRQRITLNFAEAFEPSTPINYITVDSIHRLHTIPTSNQYTAIIFRAVEDTTLSIHPVGTVSVDETIVVLDGEQLVISRQDEGVTSAALRAGGLYAILFDPQPVDRLFSFQSSRGSQSVSTEMLTNLFEPTDANADGQTTPRDVLAIINGIALRQSAEGEPIPTSTQFLDANGDGRITPLDALYVVNYLARQQPGEGEGMTIDQPLPASLTPASLLPQPSTVTQSPWTIRDEHPVVFGSVSQFPVRNDSAEMIDRVLSDRLDEDDDDIHKSSAASFSTPPRRQTVDTQGELEHDQRDHPTDPSGELISQLRR
ncbi:Putative peptidyl-prolyl cis-trans isomerase [Stieleria magnilauensis]|uniref:peptidylprolyl isomerase n=1 Tax=Stieleria magnilauensis TaxID=2527963 RepID=A0ABX5Y203_9BACT|nr:Putative peptidyl-prolyl cis-trans isomerase [Planctomycetes bacterium TBK1r]